MKLMKHALVTMLMLMFAQISYADMSADKEQKMTAKMQETQTALAITADQQAAWDGYKNSVMNRAKTLSAEKDKMKAACEGANPAPKVKGQPKVYANTAMDRIDARIHFAQTNVKLLQDQKAALEKLYKVLTPEQRKKADQMLKIK